ncbi:MAG TPA: Uma2 family endonuclease [Pilimelia sp.]|nr:Uma2 family endonuclease [Pilimelia sp.]
MTPPVAQLRPSSRQGFTTADLHALPEDGLRYELIDGSLVVSPSATGGHNAIARWLANLIEDRNPGDDFMVSTDQSATVDDHNELRPDVVVYRSVHVNRSPFPITDVLLVVEVVSPSSALRDTETKRVLYARAGVPAYWIVVADDDKETIALAELRLADDRTYGYVTHYTTDVFESDFPWPVTIDLPALAAKLAPIQRQARRA